jgi:hypothetical protein
VCDTFLTEKVRRETKKSGLKGAR